MDYTINSRIRLTVQMSDGIFVCSYALNVYLHCEHHGLHMYLKYELMYIRSAGQEARKR